MADVNFSAERSDLGFQYGDQVNLFDKSVLFGSMAIDEIQPNIFALCRLVDAGETDTVKGQAAALVNTGAKGVDPNLEHGVDGARTLWLDLDDHSGFRRKDFQQRSHSLVPLPGAEVKGTRNALHVCKEMANNGGRPSSWLDRFMSKKRVGDNDRNLYEFESLVLALQDAAEYDQLNLGGCSVIETLTRRISAIAAALKRGAHSANWSQAAEIQGRASSDNLLSTEREAEVNKPTEAPGG